MGEKDNLLQIAILLYPGVTALDAVGPWEVLSRIPNTEMRFVGKEIEPVVTEGDVLLLGVTHTMGETMSPDLVLVPGGTTTPGQIVDDEVLDWLRKVHRTTTWTASVCTGALILGAAGILKARPPRRTGTKWVYSGLWVRSRSLTNASCARKNYYSRWCVSRYRPGTLVVRCNRWSRASRSDPTDYRIRSASAI
jgi:DJ-1/PfpI family